MPKFLVQMTTGIISKLFMLLKFATEFVSPVDDPVKVSSKRYLKGFSIKE
jgi:hypothetical protein